jgi:hypothetical protein
MPRLSRLPNKRLKHASRKSASNIRSNLTLLNRGIRPLNRIADDGDLTVGNPRDPIPVLARCVMVRDDVDARDGTHYRWNVLRWDIEIGGLAAMAPSLQHL